MPGYQEAGDGDALVWQVARLPSMLTGLCGLVEVPPHGETAAKDGARGQEGDAGLGCDMLMTLPLRHEFVARDHAGRPETRVRPLLCNGIL